VAIFTDMQIWAGRHSVKDAWDGYTRDVAPDANLYIIDLSSYGDLVMPEGYNNVFRVSGWNSNVVKHIKYANQEDEAIRTVENMSPP
jgi:60 kDa SS-A/Ro ribonucleoprotein